MEHARYTPPMTTETQAHPDSPAIIDTSFFVVNFAISALLFISCVISIAAADNPFAFIGGLFMVLPVLSYAIAEWLCWYRSRHWLYRPMGILNLLLAAFLVFGSVTNVGEAVLADDPVDPFFIVIFGLGFGMFSAYLTFCGWRRLHLYPSPTGTQSLN